LNRDGRRLDPVVNFEVVIVDPVVNFEVVRVDPVVNFEVVCAAVKLVLNPDITKIMYYTPDNPFVFFHIPKTGGTTVREVMYKHLNPNKEKLFFPCKVQPCLIEMTTRFSNAIRARLTGKDLPQVEIAHYSYFLGHIDRATILERISHERGKKVTSLSGVDCMTIVRNPFQRMLSQYYMFHYVTEKVPFYAFASLRSARDTVAQLEGTIQTQRLGPTLVEAMDTVRDCETGIFEHMEEFMLLLNQTRGVPISNMHLNAPRRVPTQKDLNSEYIFRDILADEYTLWYYAANKSSRLAKNEHRHPRKPRQTPKIF
jgi:hypothetical protein